MGDEIAAGLQDPSDKVRIAAAQVCFQAMEAQRSALVQQLRQQREAERIRGRPVRHGSDGIAVLADIHLQRRSSISSRLRGRAGGQKPAIIKNAWSRADDSPSRLQRNATAREESRRVEEKAKPVAELEETV